MTQTLLGGLSPTRFLRDYWHKRPLLIRKRRAGFQRTAVARRHAASGDARRRRIPPDSGQRQPLAVRPRPFKKSDFKRLPKTEWTLLVQSLNHVLPAADALLARFNFIPHARLDDLMVSYAVPGGSVGPHFDSYDVFLLTRPGAPPLADQRTNRPDDSGRPRRSESCAISNPKKSGCWGPATCSICRRTWRITAWPKMPV